jgi:hypothetical protein
MRPILFLAALAACSDGDQYTYQGQPMYDYFSLDGERLWSYAQDDDSIDYFLYIEKVEPTRTVDDMEVVPLEMTRSDLKGAKGLVSTTEWSSDSRNGVIIHSFAVGTKAATAFEPPIVFAENEMAGGDSVETVTNAGTFTSTFIGLEACPNHWVPGIDTDPWTCAHMLLEGPGLGFEGDYWLAPRYGTALFQRIEDPDKWNLLSFKGKPE